MSELARWFAARVVVSFTLPSNGERWNWPVEGQDGIDAFVEILDRANIAWTVRDSDLLPPATSQPHPEQA